MRIGVIGCGAAGTTVLDTVVRTAAVLRQRVEVTVFDRAGDFGPGRAYRPASDTAPLNLVAAKMSARPEQPAHFASWLGADEGSARAAEHGYLPRATYGRYLADLVDSSVRFAAANGSEVTLAGERVVRLVAADGGFRVCTMHGRGQAFAREYRFDRLFLCVGSSEPVDVYGLAGRSGFVADPYPLDQLGTAIDPLDSVAVLGCGLSAVDTVLRLAEQGHRGPITLLSRSGYLPAVRSIGEAAEPLKVTHAAAAGGLALERGYLSVLDLWRLVSRECHAQGVDPRTIWREFQPDEPPASRLRRQRREATVGNRAHALLIEVAGVLVRDAWRLFDEHTRENFLRDWHSLVSGLCAPMPISSANTLCALLDAGILRISGGIRKVSAAEVGFTVDTEDEEFTVDTVVNTVRPPTAAVPEGAAHLVGGLLRAGIAVANPFGGIAIDPDTLRPLDKAGLPVPGLYALGELTAGELYIETTILGAIARRAQQAVAHVFAEGKP